MNANPENILLYIMDDNLREGFQVIRQIKSELDAIVIGRNELAKWYKRNGEEGAVKYPPMISRTGECKRCFTAKLCGFAALTLENRDELPSSVTS